jgi:hypothetical protein
MLGVAVLSIQASAARAIAAAVAPVADGLSVVYSIAAEQPEAGPGHWVQVAQQRALRPRVPGRGGVNEVGRTPTPCRC